MILSHAHRFLFVHSRKTAGSSVVVSLARVLGPEDLQLSALPETLSRGIAPTARVRREAWRTAPVTLLRAKCLPGAPTYVDAVAQAIKARYRPVIGPKPQHATAREIRDAFPEEWQSYRTFSIVRNPWDRLVSDYFWRLRRVVNKPDFPTFVRALRDGNDLDGRVPVTLASNWDSLAIDGEIAVDRVLRYERLEQDLGDFLSTARIPWDGWLPKAKGRHRAKRDYQSLYDDDARAIVAEMFAPEIDAFGYEFSPTSA